MTKEEDTEIDITEMDCLECNEKFKSQEELMEHMEDNECDHCRKWICCSTYLRKHKEKEHEMIRGEGSKEQGKKKIKSQPNQSGEDSSQKDERLEPEEELEEKKA